MSITPFLTTHILAVIVFLILFIIKAFLLFSNKTQTLETIKRKTKVADIVLGTLIVVSGGIMLLKYDSIPMWLIVKVVLVFAAIPLAITGLKKQHKPLVALAVIIFVYVYGVAESKSLTMEKETLPATTKNPEPEVKTEEEQLTGENAPAISTEMSETALNNSQQIYNQICVSCHGEDGKKRLNNGSNLTGSMLTMEERKTVILNGKGTMPGFKGQLTEQEAEELAAYTQMLGE